MMDPNNKIYLARKGLIDECMKEIRSCKEWEKLKIRVYYEIGKLGEIITFIIKQVGPTPM